MPSKYGTFPHLAVPAMLLAVTSTIVTNTAGFLLGVAAAAMDQDLHFPAWAVGAAVAGFGLGGAVASWSTPWLSRRMSTEHTLIVALTLSLGTLVAIALLAPTWHWILLWATLSGVSNGLSHPSSNDLLGRFVPSSWQGLAFGFKQAGVPLASFVAGLTVPTIVLQFNWQTAYLVCAGLSLLVLLGVFAFPSRRGAAREHGTPAALGPMPADQKRYLRVSSIMTGCGGAAASGIAAFTVLASIDRGINVALAATVFSAAGLACAADRIILGMISGKPGRASLLTIAAMLSASAISTLLMAIVPWDVVFLVAGFIAIAIGWGWAGLSHYIVHLRSPGRTREAAAIVQIGTFVGTSAGPVIAGGLVSGFGFSVMWLFMSLLAAVAVAAALVARRMGLRLDAARGNYGT